jgi:hypothetical protein
MDKGVGRSFAGARQPFQAAALILAECNSITGSHDPIIYQEIPGVNMRNILWYVVLEVLFGKKQTKATRTTIEKRLAVMGGALSALILERHFRPALLGPKDLQQFAEEIFDALLPA